MHAMICSSPLWPMPFNRIATFWRKENPARVVVLMLVSRTGMHRKGSIRPSKYIQLFTWSVQVLTTTLPFLCLVFLHLIVMPSLLNPVPSSFRSLLMLLLAHSFARCTTAIVSRPQGQGRRELRYLPKSMSKEVAISLDVAGKCPISFNGARTQS